MKIVISGPAVAYRIDTDDEVTDAEELCKLDGLFYSSDRCSKYFAEALGEIGIKGGKIQLAFDAKKNKLRVITEYEAPRQLTKVELAQLLDETTGQWSDGIGEGDFLHRKKTKLDIDLSPFDGPKPKAEQIDDGKKVAPPKKINPLHKAVWSGTVAEITKLLDEGTRVNTKDKYGSTPLHVACLAGNADVALLLLERGADACALDKEGTPPLARLGMAQRMDEVQKEKTVAVAQALLAKGAGVDTGGKEGITPLMWAANRSNFPLVKYLVEAGANVNAKDRRHDNESTVLMYPSSLEIVEFLLEQGADPALCNAGGQNAQQVALVNSHIQGFEKVAELLGRYLKKTGK